MSRSTKSAPPRRSAESSKTKSKTFQLPEGYKQSSVQEGIEDALRLHNARFSDILAVWDTDGDGTVSRKEFIAGLASMGIRGSKTDFGAQTQHGNSARVGVAVASVRPTCTAANSVGVRSAV